MNFHPRQGKGIKKERNEKENRYHRGFYGVKGKEEKMQKGIAYAYARCWLVYIVRKPKKKKKLRRHISPNMKNESKKNGKDLSRKQTKKENKHRHRVKCTSL